MENTDEESFILETSRKGRKTGLPRTCAYDNSQCIAIIRAMIAAKNDAIRGSGQKREDFHARFKEKYDKIARSDFPPRTVASLVDKFKEIRHDCSAFRGILSKIRSAPRASGTTSSDEGDIQKILRPI